MRVLLVGLFTFGYVCFEVVDLPLQLSQSLIQSGYSTAARWIERVEKFSYPLEWTGYYFCVLSICPVLLNLLFDVFTFDTNGRAGRCHRWTWRSHGAGPAILAGGHLLLLTHHLLLMEELLVVVVHDVVRLGWFSMANLDNEGLGWKRKRRRMKGMIERHQLMEDLVFWVPSVEDAA